MTSRNIGFNVQTRHDNEWYQTQQEINALATRFGAQGQYVSVWTSASDEEVNDADADGLKFDEKTMINVHQTLVFAFKDQVDPEALADRAIRHMVDAGILFRERVQ